MTELTIFNYQEQEVRTITDKEGEPWWIAKDVCSILGLSDTTRALIEIDAEDKSDTTITRVGNNISKLRIINESGLYCLIFKSRKPEAKKFKRWITHEILPSIRKTGSYSIDTPKTFIGALEKLIESEKEKECLLLEQSENKPKVEYYEKVSNAVNYHSLGMTAKLLGWGRNRFMKDLRDTNVFMGNNTPYQRYIDAGYFVVKERAYGGNLGFLNKTTFVSGKGIQWLFKRYEIKEV